MCYVPTFRDVAGGAIYIFEERGLIKVIYQQKKIDNSRLNTIKTWLFSNDHIQPRST